MRGITHLTLGLLTAVGAVALRPDLTGYSLTGVAVAGLSALAPDLDAPGSRLGRDLSFDPKYFRYGLLVVGALLGMWAWYRLDLTHTARQQALLAGIALGVLGAALASENVSRRVMLAFTGVLIVGVGGWLRLSWLAMLGGFVGIAPWLPHRSWTHTVWATLLWGYLCQAAAYALHDPGIFWLGTLGYLSHLVADSLTKAGVKWFFPVLGRSFGLPLLRTGSRRGNFWEGIITAIVAGAAGAAWVWRLGQF